MPVRALIKSVLPKSVLEAYTQAKRKHLIQKNAAITEKDYEAYLCRFYKKYTGFDMDFENPVTLTQKAQWLKLYDRDARKTICSDKYAVREYVSELIGEEYLIPLIQINGKDHFYSVDELDFDLLPNSFVIKCNHGCGYNIIVKDKSTLTQREVRKIKKKCAGWLKENYAFLNGLELVYKDIKPCILIEQYMAINDDLPDYKFMCFSGKVKYVWCDEGRYTNHRRTLFDLDYNPQPFTINGAYKDIKDLNKPQNFGKMVQIAQLLCTGFVYVRVDLYNVEGKPYFGELTFSSGSGIELPAPVQYDKVLGDYVEIDKYKREHCDRYRSK